MSKNHRSIRKGNPTRYQVVEDPVYQTNVHDLDTRQLFTARNRYVAFNPWTSLEDTIRVVVTDEDTSRQFIDQLQLLRQQISDAVGFPPGQKSWMELTDVAVNHVKYVMTKYPSFAATLPDNCTLVVLYNTLTGENWTQVEVEDPGESKDEKAWKDYQDTYDSLYQALIDFYVSIGYNDALFCKGAGHMNNQERAAIGLDTIHEK